MIRNSVKLGAGGLLYGLGLTAIGVLMAGAGHGTYLLLGIASAPLSFLGFFVSLAGPPLLWTAIGGLLPYTRKGPQNRLVVTVMLLHYLGVIFIPLFGDYAEWKYFAKIWETDPVIVLTGLSLYLSGQFIIWSYWFKAKKANSMS